MPVTVVQLIEFLKQFPPETEVDVLKGHSSRAYEGDYFSRVSLELPADPWNGDKWWHGGGVEYSGWSLSMDKATEFAPTLFLGEED